MEYAGDTMTKEDMHMAYYRRFRDLREDRDKTQAAVARALGIRQQQYQLYESGRRGVPLWAVLRLADWYGVSVDYLLGRTDDPLPPPRLHGRP